MDKENIMQHIKHLVYLVALPLYLWSIGFKTLSDYLDEVESQYDWRMGRIEKELKG